MWTWFVNWLKSLFAPKPPPITSAEPPPTPPPAPQPGFVHREGTQLLDGLNQPLKLRGVNLGGWLLWEGWMWAQGFDWVGETPMMGNLTGLVGAERADQFREGVRANYTTAADLTAIRGAGFNVVRVPFNYRLLEDDTKPGIYRDAGWGVLDRLLAWADVAGVYVVLDMHAAPCGQSLGFTADFTGPDYMWLSASCMDRAIAMWKAIAARYKDRTIIAGYDLINEVVAGDSQLVDWYTRCTKAIRQVDPNHLILYEGNNLARDFAFMKTRIDDNSALSIHDYAWMIAGDVTGRMPAYKAAAERLDQPIWVGEFGMDLNTVVAKYIKLWDAEPTFAGYALWAWKGVSVPVANTFTHTAASKAVIDYMANPKRAKPTAEVAEQGLRDFIDLVRYDRVKANTALLNLF